MNDNKITGAQNVLLLIVSGSEEITIDEIGEINDHIQAEAGHSANIIMGVGEDEALDEAISVTIIATGFNVEQQNEIVNTEAKKIIHTLEDDQRAEQDLNPKRTGGLSPVNKSKSEVSNDEQAPNPKIVHTLDDSLEEVDEIGNIHTKEDELLKTPQSARDMEVTYDEVNPDDFVINDTSAEISDQNEVKEEKSDSDEQIMFTFDFPLNNQEAEKPKQEVSTEKTSAKKQEPEIKKHDLFESSREIEVNEPVEIVPATENSSRGVKRYSLDDYMELERSLDSSKASKKEEPKDETIAFEKKTVAPKPETEQKDNEDPFNNPISEVLIERAAERRAKMKEFNYKFRSNAAQVDEFEKQPAYKRQGVDLDENKPGEGKLSRTSLGQDENDQLHFRRNNSFLHDNVD